MEELYEKLTVVAKTLSRTTEFRSSIAIEIYPDGTGILLHITRNEESGEIGTVTTIDQFVDFGEFEALLESIEDNPFFNRTS